MRFALRVQILYPSTWQWLLSEDGFAVVVCLSLCLSLLINGSLPKAVFPPSPAAQPLIIPFNS